MLLAMSSARVSLALAVEAGRLWAKGSRVWCMLWRLVRRLMCMLADASIWLVAYAWRMSQGGRVLRELEVGVTGLGLSIATVCVSTRACAVWMGMCGRLPLSASTSMLAGSLLPRAASLPGMLRAFSLVYGKVSARACMALFMCSPPSESAARWQGRACMLLVNSHKSRTLVALWKYQGLPAGVLVIQAPCSRSMSLLAVEGASPSTGSESKCRRVWYRYALSRLTIRISCPSLLDALRMRLCLKW
mmetsp:Transcript_19376/g.30896  ORF Transcript_19376/g.30896 Transcript_19376/m.30896 type:complete len:246 (-) Transcript_19376:175-912(-)